MEAQKKSNLLKMPVAAVLAGLGMWIVAGIYHNFVIPMVNPTVNAHHDGLVIMLLAYVILSSLMVYLYATTTAKRNHIIGGMMLGGIIGVLWTFPHGLALAGIHETSIVYEITNSLWHVFEQAIGGIIIASILGKI